MSVVLYPLFLIVKWSIQLFASLILGFSLVEANFKKQISKFLLISGISAIIYYVFTTYTTMDYPIFTFYLLFIPIFTWMFRLPFTQVIIAILLALTFDLGIVHLLQYNLLQMLVDHSQMTSDIVTELSLDLFVLLNNVLVAYLTYANKPVMFTKLSFQANPLSAVQQNTTLFFIIILLFLVDIGLLYSYVELPYFQTDFRLFFTFWMITICITVLFFLRNSIVHKMERSQFFLDQLHQDELLSYYSIIRSQRHDFNFHLNTIYSLLSKEDYKSSKEYIRYMVEDTRDINDLLPLHAPAIGALLNTFKEKAIAQKGIQIEFFIHDNLKTMPCSVYEMNKILGNLLQNAIEESEQLEAERRLIEMKIAKEMEQITITVTNDTNMSADQLEAIFESGHTTKTSHEGLGLPTVLTIVEKYNGVVYPILNVGKISFIIRIPTVI